MVHTTKAAGIVLCLFGFYRITKPQMVARNGCCVPRYTVDYSSVRKLRVPKWLPNYMTTGCCSLQCANVQSASEDQ